MAHFHELTAFLDDFFQVSRFPAEPRSLIREGGRPLEKVGLALEAGTDVADWAEAGHLDAVFLHRAAKWEGADTLPSGVGVLSHHLPFDEKLTTGWNLRLSDVLGLTGPEVIGWKQGRPLGMIGAVTPCSVAAFYRTVTEIFGGREEARTCERNEICRVAVVGAMTEALVHEASERDADVYLTGQLRQPGRVAMLETGIGVIAVGHKRSEEWGLRALGNVLQERFAGLEIVLHK